MFLPLCLCRRWSPFFFYFNICGVVVIFFLLFCICVYENSGRLRCMNFQLKHDDDYSSRWHTSSFPIRTDTHDECVWMIQIVRWYVYGNIHNFNKSWAIETAPFHCVRMQYVWIYCIPNASVRFPTALSLMGSLTTFLFSFFSTILLLLISKQRIVHKKNCSTSVQLF